MKMMIKTTKRTFPSRLRMVAVVAAAVGSFGVAPGTASAHVMTAELGATVPASQSVPQLTPTYVRGSYDTVLGRAEVTLRFSAELPASDRLRVTVRVGKASQRTPFSGLDECGRYDVTGVPGLEMSFSGDFRTRDQRATAQIVGSSISSVASSDVQIGGVGAEYTVSALSSTIVNMPWQCIDVRVSSMDPSNPGSGSLKFPAFFAGFVADVDGDGVPDAVDECPTVVGALADRGCPATVSSTARPGAIVVDASKLTDDPWPTAPGRGNSSRVFPRVSATRLKVSSKGVVKLSMSRGSQTTKTTVRLRTRSAVRLATGKRQKVTLATREVTVKPGSKRQTVQLRFSRAGMQLLRTRKNKRIAAELTVSPTGTKATTRRVTIAR